jgi:hypothetical protein
MGGVRYFDNLCVCPLFAHYRPRSDDDQLTRSQREAILSRLASHPHVVQTYATSVTKLTEPMFKAKVGTGGRTPAGHGYRKGMG